VTLICNKGHIKIGVAGWGGGVILSPGGNHEIKYAWGLGTSTNNQVEAYALLEVLIIYLGIDIQSLSVIGDSKNIIRHSVLKTSPSDLLLASLMERINQDRKIFFRGKVLSCFTSVECAGGYMRQPSHSFEIFFL
jgi:hypothetical protein